MIQLLICEADSDRIALLRKQLGELSLRDDLELEVYWLHGDKMHRDLEQYIELAQIVLISMKAPEAEVLARCARSRNSQCRLLIYGGEKESLPCWIPSGPVAYCPQSGDISPELLRLIREVENDQCYFHFQSRRESIHIPFGMIRYFQSDRRTVRLSCSNGKEHDFLCRLDQVEETVGAAAFVRIHKSYLVRKTVIRTLDHSTREIVLDNDERLPVSSRYWADVTGWLAGKQNNGEEEKQ